MNDQAVWEQAVKAASTYYSGLPHHTAEQLHNLIDNIMLLKQKLVHLVTEAGSSQTCRACLGECCRYGKYHVSVLDLLTYLKCDTEPVKPNFKNHPECPYSDDSGCTMSAAFRPMTCVVFNCPQVQDLLSPPNLATFLGLEQELRTAITTAETITGQRLGRPLLFICS